MVIFHGIVNRLVWLSHKLTLISSCLPGNLGNVHCFFFLIFFFVRGIGFVCFCDFPIVFWNWSDGVISCFLFWKCYLIAINSRTTNLKIDTWQSVISNMFILINWSNSFAHMFYEIILIVNICWYYSIL